MEKRNHRTETSYGPEKTFTTPEGQVVYQGPSVAMTSSVFEYDCEACGQEHTARGIIGAIAAHAGICPLEKNESQI